MTENTNDSELARICDAKTSPTDKKRLIIEHFRRAQNSKAANILARVSQEDGQGLTGDDESQLNEALGKYVPTDIRKRIAEIFGRTNVSAMDDPSELKFRNPGVKNLSNESAAEDGSERSAGLNIDRTPLTSTAFASFDPLTAASEFEDEDGGANDLTATKPNTGPLTPSPT